MPSNDLINYPFLCAAPTLYILPSSEWCPVSGAWKRTGSSPNEQSLFSEVENTSEQLFFNPHPRICLLILERENKREREGERERERETSIERNNYQLIASHKLPDQGIKPTTFWFTGQHSNRLSHQAQAIIVTFHIPSVSLLTALLVDFTKDSN